MINGLLKSKNIFQPSLMLISHGQLLIANIIYLYHISLLVREGFGSCHSFGVAVGLRGYGMCQMRRENRSTIFLKMRRVGCIIFESIPRFNFFSKSKLSAKPFTCLRGKSLLGNCQSFFLKHKFVRALLLPTI